MLYELDPKKRGAEDACSIVGLLKMGRCERYLQALSIKDIPHVCISVMGRRVEGRKGKMIFPFWRVSKEYYSPLANRNNGATCL